MGGRDMSGSYANYSHLFSDTATAAPHYSNFGGRMLLSLYYFSSGCGGGEREEWDIGFFSAV